MADSRKGSYIVKKQSDTSKCEWRIKQSKAGQELS